MRVQGSLENWQGLGLSGVGSSGELAGVGAVRGGFLWLTGRGWGSQGWVPLP